MNRSDAEMVRELRRLIYGNWQTCVTYAFAELGLADVLGDSSKSVAELAQATGTNGDALIRFLRCCGQIGFVRIDTDSGKFFLTPFGKLLGSEHPLSQRDAARLNGADYRYQPWGHLVEILKSGSCDGYSPTVPNGSLEYLADKPEKLGVFQRAMTNLSVTEDEAIAGAFDFSPFQHLIDVGCGHGTFMTAALQANPKLHGTMFDLPEVFAQLGELPAEYADRLTRIPGDFFKKIPDHGDVYTLKNVVHNWPEDKVLQILAKVREAMCASGDPARKRLLIVEYLIPEGNEESVVKWIDLNFLVLVDGADRTRGQYIDLAARAGFAVQQFIPTTTGRHILELSVISAGPNDKTAAPRH